jgi:hypothetical protein
MIKRLEQVAALVVAAGLAIVSYWLFFSWAGGGGNNRPDASKSRSEASAGLQQPLLAGRIVEAGDVSLHLVAVHRQAQLPAQGHDPLEGA